MAASYTPLSSSGPTDWRVLSWGYRFFGLEDVADLLNEAKSISKTGDDLDLWEAELDRRYGAIVPDDSTLVARFEMIFRRNPSEFAPI